VNWSDYLKALLFAILGIMTVVTVTDNANVWQTYWNFAIVFVLISASGYWLRKAHTE